MTFDFIAQLNVFAQKSEFYLKPMAIGLGIIWAVNIFNWLTGSRLNVLGIYPRHAFGLIGILCSPFLHQNFNHLFFNTIPLFVLALAIMANNGAAHFLIITAIIMGISGLAVWLFGRKGIHIGASGVISGYFGFILMEAFTSPSITTVLLAIMAIYYFGGILLGLFPQDKMTSWEYHLFGFASGVLCAYYLPYIFIIH
jgi:membrane associated rhomboid family serine protease